MPTPPIPPTGRHCERYKFMYVSNEDIANIVNVVCKVGQLAVGATPL